MGRLPRVIDDGLIYQKLVDVHTPKANVQYTTLDRNPLKSVRNRYQTNTILNTSHEPKSTTVFDLKYRSYDMFTIIQEFTEKYCGFRGSLFSVHPLSGCERLPNSVRGEGGTIRRPNSDDPVLDPDSSPRLSDSRRSRSMAKKKAPTKKAVGSLLNEGSAKSKAKTKAGVDPKETTVSVDVTSDGVPMTAPISGFKVRMYRTGLG